MPRMRLAMRSGWKTSKSESFSPVPANLMGLPVTAFTDSAAPPRVVAVQLRQDDAGDVQQVVEGLGPFHGLLAGHGVHHQQDVRGADGLFNPPQLFHQRLVDLQPAGGVDNHVVVAVVFGVADGLLRGEHRVLGALFKHGRTGLLPTTCSCLLAAGR